MNRHVGHVVCFGRENQGTRHALWNTCEHGIAMTFGRGSSGSGSDSGSAVLVTSVSWLVDRPLSGVAFQRCSPLLVSDVVSASSSRSASQQIAQIAPSALPSLIFRILFTRPSFTASKPLTSFLALTGSSRLRSCEAPRPRPKSKPIRPAHPGGAAPGCGPAAFGPAVSASKAASKS